MDGRISLARIAAELGLSVPTVSRALRGTGRIGAETRRRVAAAAAAAGWKPRTPEPPAPAAVRPRLLAIAQPVSGQGPAHLTWPRVLRELARLAAAGHDVTVERMGPQALARWTDAVCGGAPPRTDGVLLLQRHDPVQVARLAARMPVASVIFDYPGSPVDVAAPDNEAAGRLQAEHLLALGHTRIGWLGWELDAGWSWRRLGGFLATLVRHDAVPRRRDVLASTAGDAGVARQLVERALRRSRAGVTAWGTAGDHVAHRLLQRLAAAGLAVPGQVSLTGVDGLPPRGGLPALVSVRMPVEEAAGEAVALLERRIARPGGPPRLALLAPTLVAGSSTAPPLLTSSP